MTMDKWEEKKQKEVKNMKSKNIAGFIIIVAVVAVVTHCVAIEGTITSEELYEIADDYRYAGFHDSWNNYYPEWEITGNTILVKGIVGETVTVEGYLSVSLGTFENPRLLTLGVAHHPVSLHVYTGDMEIYTDQVETDENGNYKLEFIPRESGYYKAIIKAYNGKEYGKVTGFTIHASSQTPPQTVTPTPMPPAPTPIPSIPGFEAIFAIAGLLTVTYLLRRRK